ncbi:MAG: DUF2252 domain-containing protein [Streptosporangiaceae bacterium]
MTATKTAPETVTETAHLSVGERTAIGKRARSVTPLSGHSGWIAAAGRPDPVAVLRAQDRSRAPDLVPIRHGRMMASPFTFYRGAAAVMAADIKDTPVAGLDVQLCGDAHLLNFGVFASPERLLLFDVNDFDETLPGPFEYDLKRLAASLTIAGRTNGFAEQDARASAAAAVTAYREAMAEFAGMRTMEIWYSRLSEQDLIAAGHGIVAREDAKARAAKGAKAKKARKKAKTARKAENLVGRTEAKAYGHNNLQALARLSEVVNGRHQIVSQPPVLVPERDLATAFSLSAQDVGRAVRDQLRAYRATLPDDRRHLLDRFEIVDMARKVVGVGSVGTRDYVVLLQGRDTSDPLFLQIKEATASVYESYLGKSRYRQHGERVVQGQRMMQAASDIFLGWTRGPDRRHFYWRQLRDMKGTPQVESMRPVALAFYARICGWTLARAHARSGDPVAIAAYLGGSDAFDTSIADFAVRYADQNEQDYAEFVRAIRSGKLQATEGI